MAGALREWHDRYCAEIDGAMERSHMALREAGVDAQLVRVDIAICDRGWHLTVRTFLSQEEAALRATELATPPEMYSDWLRALDEDDESVFTAPKSSDVIVR